MTERIAHLTRSKHRRGIFAASAMLTFSLVILSASAGAQEEERKIDNWLMQDASKVAASPLEVSQQSFRPENWYRATVLGTVLTTLVENKVFPEPLYGENMRAIPESLNKTDYLYRTTFVMPAAAKGKLTWLHFAGINYSARIWVNGNEVARCAEPSSAATSRSATTRKLASLPFSL